MVAIGPIFVCAVHAAPQDLKFRRRTGAQVFAQTRQDPRGPTGRTPPSTTPEGRWAFGRMQGSTANADKPRHTSSSPQVMYNRKGAGVLMMPRGLFLVLYAFLFFSSSIPPSTFRQVSVGPAAEGIKLGAEECRGPRTEVLLPSAPPPHPSLEDTKNPCPVAGHWT
jgi:hypothetical protein